MIYAYVENDKVSNVAEWLGGNIPAGWKPTEDKDVAIGDTFTEGVFLSPEGEPRKNMTDRLQDVYISVEKLGLPLDKAAEVRALIDKLLTDVPLAEMDEYTEMLPTLKYDGSLIKHKYRIQWEGQIKQAAADLWDLEIYNPANAPVYWEDVIFRDGYRVIPETITVGLAFSLGEKGWWKDKLRESLLATNVYTPDQYAAGWKEAK